MIATRRFMCDEKVERDCSIDCSSPTSTKISSNNGTFASLTGIGKPQIAIKESNPAVFNATVLPPVLLPLISKMSCGFFNTISFAIISF